MGCCGSSDEQKAELSIANSTKENETKTVGLAPDSTKSETTKEKHSRRQSSTKGMTRLAMKFPHIRRAFKACKKVFNSCSGDKNYITKSEVRPLLIQLGAESALLTNSEIDRIVNIANLDGDDKIDFKEFLIAAAVGCFLNDNIDQNKCSEEFKKNRKGFMVAREAFDTIDADKSGEIDFEELKGAFLAMQHDEFIMERLKELDFNGDKSIEFPEFVWGITAWVGMDPDADDIDENDFEFDTNTEQNVGTAVSPKQRLSIDNTNNYNKNINPTDDPDD
eukprot:437541_1